MRSTPTGRLSVDGAPGGRRCEAGMARVASGPLTKMTHRATRSCSRTTRRATFRTSSLARPELRLVVNWSRACWYETGMEADMGAEHPTPVILFGIDADVGEGVPADDGLGLRPGGARTHIRMVEPRRTIMKASVVSAPNARWEVKEVATPQPGPNQVLIRIRASGLCYTDRHITKGHIPTQFPRTLGHEPVGEIAAVGPGGTTRPVGDPVGGP